MPRPPFSFRGFLLLIVAAAGFCWYRDLPRQNANAFVASHDDGDYDAADALLTDRYLELPARVPLSEYSRVIDRRQLPADWVAGRAFVQCGDAAGDLQCAFVATAAGVEPQHFEATQFADEAQ